MAENNYRDNDERGELSQDDPFAELTRIMGHDPRSLSPLLPGRAPPAGDLALELESELLGDPDVQGVDEGPVQAEVIPWRHHAEPSASQPVVAEHAAGSGSHEASFEESLLDELDGIFGEDRDRGGHTPSAADEQWMDNGLPAAEAAERDWSNNRFVEDTYAQSHHAQAPWERPSEPEPTTSAEEYPGDAYDAANTFAHQSEGEGETPFDYGHAAAARSEFLTAEADAPFAASGAGSFEPSPSEPAWEPLPAEGAHDAREEGDLSGSWFEEAAPAVHTRFGQWHENPPVEQPAAEPRSARGRESPPEIETVEVAESAVPAAQNLDIPEIRYKEEVKPAPEFDEIEEILAGAFGETAESPDLHGASWTATPVAGDRKETPAEDDDFFATGIAVAAGLQSGAGAAAEFADRPAAGVPHYQDRWVLAEGQDSLKPAPGVAPPVEASGSRFASYASLAVGAVGGLIILGGAAFLALTYGGGDGAEPVLVAADDSPVKVRPDDPGGIKIPNQESEVYKRVSGEQAADARPAQRELISTAEEPVELVQPAEGRADLRPAVDEQEGNLEVTDEVAAKIEERLTTSADEGSDTDESVIALTPRRVRSLVVRPDGTMVPREIPEPAETTGATASDQTNDPATADDTSAVAANDESQGTAQDVEAIVTAAATTTVPQTGPIPPSRPANAAAADQAQARPSTPQGILSPRETPQSAPPQQQMAAVSPTQGAAAADSGWSVQISSQPTVEGAQQSYQQLAQRFGEVLQGRGVNIVKADIQGKGTYYRVRIPSSSKDDAIDLCTRLKSAGGSCFVSK